MFRISNLIDLDLVFYRWGFSWGGEANLFTLIVDYLLSRLKR